MHYKKMTLWLCMTTNYHVCFGKLVKSRSVLLAKMATYAVQLEGEAAQRDRNSMTSATITCFRKPHLASRGTEDVADCNILEDDKGEDFEVLCAKGASSFFCIIKTDELVSLRENDELVSLRWLVSSCSLYVPCNCYTLLLFSLLYCLVKWLDWLITMVQMWCYLLTLLNLVELSSGHVLFVGKLIYTRTVVTLRHCSLRGNQVNV